MKIPAPDLRKRYARFPWRELRAVGDHFDVPAEVVAERGKSISNAVSAQARKTGELIRCITLRDASMRVILVDTGEVRA